MELLVAGFDDIKFNVEIALDEQHGALPLPFNGMDSKSLFKHIFRISVYYYLLLYRYYTKTICILINFHTKNPVNLIMYFQKINVNRNG